MRWVAIGACRRAGRGRRRPAAARLLSALLLISCAAAEARNLVENPGFELGLEPWITWGDATLTRTSDLRHDGDFCGRVSDRTEAWQGAVQPLLGMLTDGTTYRVSAWVRVGGSSAQDVDLMFVQTDDRGDVYTAAARSTALPDRWVWVSAVFHYREENGTVSRVDFYVQGPAAGVDLFVDDVEILALPEDWKADANERIDQLRKRDVRIRVTDAAGMPVPGATVQVAQTGRRFPIGTAIAFPAFNNEPAYREYIIDHFNWAVHENEAKWYANEALRNVVTFEEADAILDFTEVNGIAMRGHAIFWAPERWQPSWVPDLGDAELELEVEQRLDDAVSHFRGRFRHWDVNNEMLHGSFFRDRLGEDIRKWMFDRTREIDPDVELFVNDYNIIAGPEADSYVQQIQGFLDQGVPIDGIGVQGHFREVDPWSVLVRLDKVAQFGLPVWVTELDVELADPEARADGLETALRTAFSHPAVDGIVLWGFWAGSHWKGADAALIDLDWSANAAGQRFEDLLAEWTSVETRVSNSNGVARARVFHGQYRVDVSVPGYPATTAMAEIVPGEAAQRVEVGLGIEFDPDFSINAGHAGAWFNPATPGQGVFLDVEPTTKHVFLSWFTYTAASSVHPSEQRWLTAQGAYSGRSATLDLYETLGGRFDAAQAVVTSPVGQVTLSFADCEQGQLEYHIDGEGLQGSFPLARVIPGSGALCEEKAGSGTQAVIINAGMDGAWYDPEAPGQGFFVDAQPGSEGDGFIFVSWFTFGDGTASGQRWLTAQGDFAGAAAAIPVYETTGGLFDDPAATSTVTVGTLELDFSDCNNAQFRYSLPADGAEGNIALTRVVPGGQATCEELAVAE